VLFLRKPGMRGPNEQNETSLTGRQLKLGKDRNNIQPKADGDG
jgi:hypothetical protein